MIIVIIISIILCILGILYCKRLVQQANEIKIDKHKEQEVYDKQLEQTIYAIQQKQADLAQASFSYHEKEKEVNQLEDQRLACLKSINNIQQEFNNIYKTEEDKLRNKLLSNEQKCSAEIQSYKDAMQQGFNKYTIQLEQQYVSCEQEFDKKLTFINQQIQSSTEQLEKIKTTLNAAIDAQLRDEAQKDNKTFYTLQLDSKALNEIDIINSIQSRLSDPRPLRMLIWTSYYSKKANDLCNRILGKEKITGIYKITNINNNMCYIGQAKDVKERWREHMKCGLGIDTPAGNKLYIAMLKEGLHNFTFELLTACAEADLNEQERTFIDIYSSYEFGYNSTRGNK